MFDCGGCGLSEHNYLFFLYLNMTACLTFFLFYKNYFINNAHLGTKKLVVIQHLTNELGCLVLL